MEKESYKDFSLRLHQQILSRNIPVNGTIEVTRRCPLTCAHCYNNLPMSDRDSRSRELSYAEHCRIIDELVDAGCLWLLYSGGEIFARADFLDIYQYAWQRGMIITLFTNGILINEKIANRLVDYPPFEIEITLYGRTRETYERLTGIPGSYDRCLRGINLLIERQLPLKLKTVAVTINQHEIWDMKQFAEEELGLEFKFDAMINPRIDCSQSPLAVRLKPEEVVALDLADAKRIVALNDFAGEFCRPKDKQPETGATELLYNCGGGLNSFAIDPYGQLSICVLSHFDTYDLRQGSFQYGWQYFINKLRHEKKITRVTKCVACNLKSVCGMCPANGELEHGDPEKPIDFLCQVAHLRAIALGMPVAQHGDCEYCPGGSDYEAIVEKAIRLKSSQTMKKANGRAKLGLPIIDAAGLSSVSAHRCGSGCGSCARD